MCYINVDTLALVQKKKTLFEKVTTLHPTMYVYINCIE